MSIFELVEIYADAWRKMDVAIVEPFLADSFTYSSMWVFETLDKNGYLVYLQGKFDAIKRSGSIIEVTTGMNDMGIPSVILRQDGSFTAFITVKESEGKISEAYMLAF